MKVQTNFSLKNYNTFGIEAKAKLFIEAQSEKDILEILEKYKNEKKFILGGGSNMLLTQDIDALVIQINLKGISIIKEDANFVWVEAKAGENWHQFVLWTIEQNFGGLENMSLIPGNVGTTPVQNIGAYGTEIKDTFENCKAIEILTHNQTSFTNEQCQFGYRESIFKNIAKDKYIITSVTYKLTKNNHKINSSYGDIQKELESLYIQNPTIKDVSNAIIAIRQKKLPDPKILGNSGSFFKNPIISTQAFETIKSNHPDIPFYTISEKEVKIPAGWLIEQAGFKGKKYGDAGIHQNQALVLVNYGKATGNEILQVAKLIQKEIKNKYNISIEAEVNII